MPELRGSHGDSPTNVLTRWFGTPDLHTLDVYESKAGGYAALRKALLDMAPADITNEVKTSGLRGRGTDGCRAGSPCPSVSDRRSLWRAPLRLRH